MPRRTRTETPRHSLAELRAELRRRHGALTELHARRAALHAQLREIDEAIATTSGALLRLSASGDVRRRQRARNARSLAGVLEQVLGAGEMDVGAAVEAVLRTGYQSTAANFRMLVNQTLINDPRFERVARGRYRLAPRAPSEGRRRARRKRWG